MHIESKPSTAPPTGSFSLSSPGHVKSELLTRKARDEEAVHSAGFA